MVLLDLLVNSITMVKKSMLFLFLLIGYLAIGQTVDYANSVRFSANKVGNALILNWIPEAGATGYLVKRRIPGSNYKLLANLSGSATSLSDTSIQIGLIYEYEVTRQSATATVTGVMAGGIEVNPIHGRNCVLLVVTSAMDSALVDELATYAADLEMEGWCVKKTIVGEQEAVTSIKGKIKMVYDEGSLRSLVLIGHVPVPYSGLIAPDGHTPDHSGAWPADVYYADMDGVWTDDSVNSTQASGTRNDNVPGDGKFDQSNIPGKVELEIGRIDLSNLPVFNMTEEALMIKYFNKNHHFRSGQLNMPRRGLIQNNFPSFGEAFGRSGVNNFSRMFGSDSVFYLPYKTSLQKDAYLWSYGCGAGNYTGASGIGASSELPAENHLTIFTMLFGSYFGDWDNSNNYLRAVLGSGLTLTNAWAGRPHWYFHHMAIGEPIGYSARITQNNTTEFPGGFGAGAVHIALIGDPTLIQYPFKGIDSLAAEVQDNTVRLHWTRATEEGALGYFVYRKTTGELKFTLLNETISADTTFTDECVNQGKYSYMVRTVKLETTGSGSFYNLSPGKATEVIINLNVSPFVEFTASTNFDKVSLSIKAEDGEITSMDMGDGTIYKAPVPDNHLYMQPGQYTICLTAENKCESLQVCDSIQINLSLPIFDIRVVQPVCHGDKGSLIMEVKEVNAPYQIYWSSGDTTQIIDSLNGGSYTLSVITTTGRTAYYGPYTLTAPEPLGVTLEINGIIDVNEGYIYIKNISGGRPPYAIWWADDTTNHTYLLDDLFAGDFLLRITDSLGCVLDTLVEVPWLMGMVNENIKPGEVHLLYKQDKLKVVCDQIHSDGQMYLFGSDGRVIGIKQFDTAATEVEWDVANLVRGVYVVAIRTGNKMISRTWVR
ncbi:MAG: hypothetical protein IPN29_14790 [Saprospiraceae bacterium]|nr:hypothetical protein [Saprospiraceae bacterium]